MAYTLFGAGIMFIGVVTGYFLGFAASNAQKKENK